MSSNYLLDFPVLNQKVNGKRLVYLDNAATTHKPLSVIKAVDDYYNLYNANPHRGAYYLSVKSTELYEESRQVVKDFIGAKDPSEIIFTKGATESFNLLAYSYGMHFLKEGDEIVISIAEHHSNLVPWQIVAKAKGAILKYMYINEEGIIPEKEIESKIGERTKIVSVTHVSNALGAINPIETIIKRAHEVGAIAIIDGSQSVPHMAINVSDLDVDFLVFSGHKMLAPMGIGVLYGKRELLEAMPPFLYGGDMIEYVTEQEAEFAQLPQKFEGGTQNVAGAVGLSEAIKYINKVGMNNIKATEKALTSYALIKMSEIPYMTIYGTEDVNKKSSVISFNIQEVHPHDVASILDADGISIRAGHHCAHPLMQFLGANATCRVSFYLYNTIQDVDNFIDSIKAVRKWLGYGS